MREDLIIARKTYSEESRRGAGEPYRSTRGATVVGIAGDLGIMDGTLQAWPKAAGILVRGHLRRAFTSPPPGGETPAQEMAQRQARVR